VVDLASSEGAGGDQVVEVAGRLPQLPVALADGGGGDSGQLLGQGRPRIAVSPGRAGRRKLHRTNRSLRPSAFQSRSQRWRDLGQRGVEIAAGDPLVGVAAGVAAGWGDDIAAAAPPIHMLQVDRVDVAEAGAGQVDASIGCQGRLTDGCGAPALLLGWRGSPPLSAGNEAVVIASAARHGARVEPLLSRWVLSPRTVLSSW
jgi:hypothetical protein